MKTTTKGLVIILSAMLQTSVAQAGLIISEYVEGSSYNKALELFNTGLDIDFASSNYVLELYTNGSPTVSRTIPLAGSVSAGGTFVVADSRAADELALLANQTTGSLSFNGDDSLVLKQDGMIIDSLGQVGTDPGAGWGSDSSSTANNTLRRMAGIVSGDIDIFDAFDPALQWTGFGVDDFSGIGRHTLNTGFNDAGGQHGGSVNVPEPGTVLLLLAGMLGMLLSAGRKTFAGPGLCFTAPVCRGA
jgi:hypothetical protein